MRAACLALVALLAALTWQGEARGGGVSGRNGPVAVRGLAAPGAAAGSVGGRGERCTHPCPPPLHPPPVTPADPQALMPTPHCERGGGRGCCCCVQLSLAQAALRARPGAGVAPCCPMTHTRTHRPFTHLPPNHPTPNPRRSFDTDLPAFTGATTFSNVSWTDGGVQLQADTVSRLAPPTSCTPRGAASGEERVYRFTAPIAMVRAAGWVGGGGGGGVTKQRGACVAMVRGGGVGGGWGGGVNGA